MKLAVNSLKKSFGAVSALNDLSFEVPDGAFYALLGPSAAGKTTTLRTICGLEKPDEGQVFIDGEDVTHGPIQGRDLAMVFQSFALYPHLSVEKNLAYPLKEAGLSQSEIKSRVNEMGELLRIQHGLKRKTSQLSGGEQQRVAIGRALIRRPKLLLLDEPLTNLDAKLRDEMRAEFKRLHKSLEITIVYSTPDQLEAMTMADTIGVIKEGSIVASGTPQQLYKQPQNLDVAKLVGSPPINLFQAEVETKQLDLGFMKLNNSTLSSGSLTVGVRPYDVHISSDSKDTMFDARVTVTEPLGDIEFVDVEVSQQRIKIALTGSHIGQVKPGDILPLHFNPDHLLYFDSSSGLRIDHS